MLAATLVASFFYLGSKIDTLGADLRGAIAAQGSELSARIDSLAARLDARLDSLAERLDAHITGDRPAG